MVPNVYDPTSDGSYGNTEKYRIDSNVGIPSKKCIDIDGRTHSIYLARGIGLINRRKMTAYSQTGCPATHRIETITDRTGGAPCVNVDSVLVGKPGAEESQGRIMSVWFIGY